MRNETVSLGKDAQIPFQVGLGNASTDASTGPDVTEVWLNGVYDAALTTSAAVSQLQDAAAANVAGSYFLELETSTLTVADSVIAKVVATPTGGTEVDELFSVSIVDPASSGVSSIN